MSCARARSWIVAVVLSTGCGNVRPSREIDASVDAGAIDVVAIDVPTAADAPAEAAPSPTAISIGSIAAFNLAPRTFTKVLYDNVIYDDRSEFDTTNARFTASHAGDFQVCASIYLGASVKMEIDIFVDGARYRAIAGGIGGVEGCHVVRLAKGSKLEVWAYHEGPSTVTASNESYRDWFTIHEQHATASLANIASFAAAPGAFTKVPYQSEDFDEHREFDEANSAFTATDAGDYQICAGITLGLANVGFHSEVSLFVNGTRERELFATIGASTGCRVVRLVAGDVIDVRLLNDSSSPLTIPADQFWDWITVQRVVAHVALGDNSSFAVPDKTFTRVAYSSVLFDDESEFDASIGRFTAGTAGDYDVCARLWDGKNVTEFELDLFVNGAREKVLGFSDYTPGGCRVVRLAKGDHIDVDVYQASGATVTVPPNFFWNWLTVRML